MEKMLNDIANLALFAVGWFSFVGLTRKWIEIRWPEKPSKEEPIEVEWKYVDDNILPKTPQKFLPPHR